MSRLRGVLTGTALTMALTAGCTSTTVEDGKDDSFAGDGKADSAGVQEGTPGALGVLDVVNTASIEELDGRPPEGAGLSSRAVDNLMYFRLGDDGAPGTDDDGVFETLAELDAIPYIGPKAFELLLAYAEVHGYADAHRTAITIAFEGRTAPQLVAVRDGIGGAWRLAEATSPLAFQARVGGQFVLAVVCEDPVTRRISLFQEARTAEEGLDLVQTCDGLGAPGGDRVTGRMQQAGSLALGTASARSSVDDWAFELRAPAGTFDLIASSADRVAIRRGITVAGDVALSPQIDLALEGAALAPVAFTATNATETETLTTDIRLSTSSTPSASIYRGALDTARIAPGAILAASDRQTASIRAVDGGKFRALRRPVQVGASTAFALPAPLGERFSVEDGRFAASWSSLLPDLSYFSISADFDDGQTAIFQTLYLSPAFLEVTPLRRAAIDTDIPGFKPEWRIDFTREHYRDVFAQSFANGEIATVTNSELVNSPQQAFVAPVARGPLAELRRGAEQP